MDFKAKDLQVVVRYRESSACLILVDHDNLFLAKSEDSDLCLS